MEIPGWLCKKVYEIDQRLRLAWHGLPKLNEADENPGFICVIQLAPRRKVGSFDDPVTYATLWDPAPWSPFYRGPIFSKSGRPSRDFDESQVPLYVINLDEMYTKEAIFTGRFLHSLTMKAKAWKDAEKQAKEQLLKAAKADVKDIAGGMTDHFWSLSNKTDSASVIMPWKHAREEVIKAVEKPRRPGLERVFS